jgi:hypothetical protein
MCDCGVLAVVLLRVCPPARRNRVLLINLFGIGSGLCFLRVLTKIYPDDYEQCTAYWTGLALQVPIGWLAIRSLLKYGTAGQCLLAWYVRLGMISSDSLHQAHVAVGPVVLSDGYSRTGCSIGATSTRRKTGTT